MAGGAVVTGGELIQSYAGLSNGFVVAAFLFLVLGFVSSRRAGWLVILPLWVVSSLYLCVAAVLRPGTTVLTVVPAAGADIADWYVNGSLNGLQALAILVGCIGSWLGLKHYRRRQRIRRAAGLEKSDL